jgi:lipopolysaccharide biosynthesis protein
VNQEDQQKILAFYLPQFHEIPENSRWWGEGFTEWKNVKKALPVFGGHHQPLLPTETGFYDLSKTDVMRQQVKLAKSHGIGGFVYYFYSFNGKRLLEKPLNNFLKSDIDFPYALCWANENWTKRWDGGDKSVLMPQDYLPGFEDTLFEQLLPHLEDKRYLRHQERPMLLIYRAQDLPDPKSSIERLKNLARKAGLGDLYVLAVASFGLTSASEVGADGLVEFPPQNSGAALTVQPPNTKPNFRGHFFDTTLVAKESLQRLPSEEHFYRGIVPGWDNTARNQNTSSILINDSPQLFKNWLTYLRKYSNLATLHYGQANFIFVNAWNEWAEGAILEPSNRFGRKMLEAVVDSEKEAGLLSFEGSRRQLFDFISANQTPDSKPSRTQLLFSKLKLFLSFLNPTTFSTVLAYLKSDPTGVSLFKAIVGTVGAIGKSKLQAPRDLRIFETKDAPDSPAKVLLVAHIYYSEYVDGLAAKINANPLVTQVFVTCTEQAVQQSLLAELSELNAPFTVELIENRGRNFQSVFVTAANVIREADVDFVTHIHSKLSLHSPREFAIDWANRLWQFGLENSKIMKRACTLMKARPEIAFAYADVDDLIPITSLNWLANETLGRDLFARLNKPFPSFMKGETPFAFPAGGMFTAEIGFFRSLLELNLSVQDFPSEDGQLDVTMQHALERFIGAYAIAEDRLAVKYSFAIDGFLDPRY